MLGPWGVSLLTCRNVEEWYHIVLLAEWCVEPCCESCSCLPRKCLYGIFFVLCLTSIFLLGRRRRFPSPNVRTYTHPLFVGTVLLALSITAHWLLTDIRLFQALIYFEGGTEPVLFLGDLSQATKIAQTATLVLSVFIFDAMMIYRVWVVWSYSIYVTVFPMLCWIVYAVCGSIMLYHSSLYKLGSDVFDMPIGDWMTALCVFMICHSSIYSTVMIALRICQTSLRVEIFGKDPAMRAIAVFTESAALYATWTIFFFVTYEAGSNLQNIANATCPAMAGIASMLINVRVGLGWAFKPAPRSTAQTSIPLSFVHSSRQDISRELTGRSVDIRHILEAREAVDEDELTK